MGWECDIMMPNRTRLQGAISRVVLAAALGVVGLLPGAVYAQADPGEDQGVPPTVDVAAPAEPSDGPVGRTLQCSVLGLRIMAPEVGGARFVCLVDGASPGDATFTVRATPATADSQIASRLRPATCVGSLVDGAGTCSGIFLDRATSVLNPLSLAATLQPSGATVGPVSLAAETTPPAVRIGPFVPTAPTAPMSTFPLPEP